MTAYKVILSKQVRKRDLQKVPSKARRRFAEMITQLQSEPRPSGAVKLTNREEYRLRSGNYRILYVINDAQKMVEIRKIGHRGSVYE